MTGPELPTDTGPAPQARPVPRWVAPLFGALAALTVPWAGYLAATLPRHAVVAHYRAAWVGFDIGLVVALALTAVLAYRGHRRVAMAATATAVLLLVDAWFDVTTTPYGPDLLFSAALALVVELPLAGLCLWIAWHSDRVVQRRLRRPPPRTRPPDGGPPAPDRVHRGTH
ncbi:hypothetical protein [Plantactinospora sp. KBS50]|uniref:hypothetical protein n=1 Tax=Plantactinospora sp. KBS50 TaxID=2024580 RepID=UPI000BAB153D|nr:hypothetical protein [Plantactinospora sp. KBS50]ASW54488.1 hypothetical protein CIK06_10265 [Plantactinospora sp. KBS50]